MLLIYYKYFSSYSNLQYDHIRARVQFHHGSKSTFIKCEYFPNFGSVHAWVVSYIWVSTLAGPFQVGWPIFHLSRTIAGRLGHFQPWQNHCWLTGRFSTLAGPLLVGWDIFHLGRTIAGRLGYLPPWEDHCW